ncbi:desmoplakin [Drosophila virilis]|uniref:Uncharacterized protein n=1 Tax=Drosophila virilis TaxID=7244 RepID=B4M8J5_DROVI|nr:uncharacterized protein LOC6634296 [Drosophila virilis]EDW57521.1 uncharacterized protein Dvir_GJ18135 [Drosophila virilis]
MKSQLVVLIVCLAALCVAEEQQAEQQAAVAKHVEHGQNPNNDPIRRILEENTEVLQKLDIKAHSISNSQKGIENKLRLLGQDVAGIGRLEDGLKKLERVSESNFQQTANGIKILSASIRAAENRTDRAIVSLARGQQDIKQVLVKVDANQNRYERNLDQVAKSVHQHLSGLDNLLKQSVLKELVALVQLAKKLDHAQRHIEGKVNHLDELTALSSITANKVQHLELGLRSVNSTQQRQLAAIGQTVQQVGATTWQIDNKLGVLLSTQKNIERALVECKKCYREPEHKDHVKLPEHPQEHWEQPAYINYEHKDQHKTPSKPDYDSGYANADEASYLYQLWYGKDDK